MEQGALPMAVTQVCGVGALPQLKMPLRLILTDATCCPPSPPALCPHPCCSLWVCFPEGSVDQ